MGEELYVTFDGKMIWGIPNKKKIKKMLKAMDKESRNERVEKLTRFYKDLKCVPDDIYKTEQHNFVRIEKSIACGNKEHEFLSLFGTLESSMAREIGYQYDRGKEKNFSDCFNEYQEIKAWDKSMEEKVEFIYQSKRKRNKPAHGILPKDTDKITQEDLKTLYNIVFDDIIPHNKRKEKSKAKKKVPKWLNSDI